MKRILKGIIFASVSLIALDSSAKKGGSAQEGQGPALSIGGSITASGIATNQKVRQNGPETLVQSKGSVVFNVSGKADNGLGYGALAVLELDRAKSNSDRVSEAYVYLNHDNIGNIRIGDTEGVEKVMMYTGGDVLGGLGGASGDLNKMVNVTRGVDFTTNIAPSNDTAPKIAYVSPTMHGFQLGLSYTPNSRYYGRFNINQITGSAGAAATSPYTTKHLAGGLSYNKVFTNFNLGLYLVGVTGKGNGVPAGPAVHNTNAWQIGTLLDYKNFQIAASYFDNGKSLVNRTTNWKNTHGVDVALGYDFARNANAAIGYTHTQRKVTSGDAKADIATATVDYVLVPGLVMFGEVDYFRFRAPTAYITGASPVATGGDIYANVPTTNINNNGMAFIVGTKLRF